jgi:hypothetical protein
MDQIQRKMAIVELGLIDDSELNEAMHKKMLETIFEEWVEIASHTGIGIETQTDFTQKVFIFNGS